MLFHTSRFQVRRIIPSVAQCRKIVLELDRDGSNHDILQPICFDGDLWPLIREPRAASMESEVELERVLARAERMKNPHVGTVEVLPPGRQRRYGAVELIACS